jgi:hypothetical protein
VKPTGLEDPYYAAFSILPSPHPPRSKYPFQHPVLKYPQSMFLPYCQRPSFTPIQNHSQNGGLAYSEFYISRLQTKGRKGLYWMVAIITITETGNCLTLTEIRFSVYDRASYLDRLTDRPSVVTWLWFWLAWVSRELQSWELRSWYLAPGEVGKS